MDAPRDLSPVTDLMVGLGFLLATAEAGTMDSGVAHSSNGTERVALWKDRSQWFIGDEREVLEPLGCWRAFDDLPEFCEALLRYVRARHA
jgi:hypothetical protein